LGCISNRLALTTRWIELPNAHLRWDSIQMCTGDMRRRRQPHLIKYGERDITAELEFKVTWPSEIRLILDTDNF
jgi:hypothetical protein